MAAIDALVFWWRRQGMFWLLALPIVGLAAGTTYVLETDRQWVDWRQHWGWNFLFAMFYAMFLDRWIKEALLDEAMPCDEVDALRRSTVGVRFLSFAAALSLLAVATAPCPYLGLNLVLCAAAASLFVLLLPSLAAGKPLSLDQAFTLARPMQTQLFLLIAGAMLLSLLAGDGLAWGSTLVPNKPWNAAAVAAGQRLVDCLLLAFVGYALATVFRRLTDWQPPEPDDRPVRGMRLRARKA
jgi:hypothetical protein